MRYLLIALLAVGILGCGGEVNQKEFAELKARVDQQDGVIEDLLAINKAQNETMEIFGEINKSQTEAIGNLIELAKRR